MAFINQAVTVLQTLVIALGAGLAVWGVVNLMEGYGNDNPGAKSQGIKLVNTIIVNTKGDGDKSGEDFWVKAEKLYYTALIGYIWYEAPDHEKNFTTLLEMINASEAREDDETFKNPVDVMFDEL